MQSAPELGGTFSVKFGESHAFFGLFELFDFQLGVFQSGFAGFEQFIAFLKFGQQLSQGHVAGLHGLDNTLEFGEGGFKGKFGIFGFHGPTMR